MYTIILLLLTQANDFSMIGPQTIQPSHSEIQSVTNLTDILSSFLIIEYTNGNVSESLMRAKRAGWYVAKASLSSDLAKYYKVTEPSLAAYYEGKELVRTSKHLDEELISKFINVANESAQILARPAQHVQSQQLIQQYTQPQYYYILPQQQYIEPQYYMDGGYGYGGYGGGYGYGGYGGGYGGGCAGGACGG